MTYYPINTEGWLDNSQHLPSPNHEARPDKEISLIVLHNISLPPFEYNNGAIDTLFTNKINPSGDPFFDVVKNFRVSSHLLIRRTGAITQYVSFLDMAYHAGVSNFKDRSHCNQFSIGIEIEGCDFEPYEEAQYQSLFKLLESLIEIYPSIEYITGHQQIAPQRKTDPGHFFDWTRLQQKNFPVVL